LADKFFAIKNGNNCGYLRLHSDPSLNDFHSVGQAANSGVWCVAKQGTRHLLPKSDPKINQEPKKVLPGLAERDNKSAKEKNLTQPNLTVQKRAREEVEL
jgi:hypothetical protein